MEVIIGAEGKHLIFLKEQFQNLEYVEFPGYRISYSKFLPVGAMVSLQVPQIIYGTNKEHTLLNKLIEGKKIDAVISDNRYGLWNERIPCVIISHQLNIQSKLLNHLAGKVTHSYIKHFNESWIPDYEGKENLSGVLSHPIPEGINAKYLGPLSRFESLTSSNPKNVMYDLLVLLSGPEPQRSKLEDMLLKQLKELPSVKTVILQGLPGSKPKESGLKNVDIIPHLTDKEFKDSVNSAEVTLCRGGYSTLMDLNAIGWKKTIFIPTPGQTEQEYLGKLMQSRGMAVTFNQKGFSLKDALQKAKQLNLVPPDFGKENFTAVVDEWLKSISK